MMLVIGDCGNAAYIAGEFTEEKSFWIGSVEAFRIVQARIPTLG